jgi:RNA polymerase sigma-70 factor (ECF subfamily)
MDDLQAIRRLKGGDIGGLETLITRYQEKAIRAAYLVTHNKLTAEDVVQDTFVRFYERIGHFDEHRTFEPYFMRGVVNAALNAIKKENRSAAFDDEIDATELENLLADAISVEKQVEYEQLKDEILKALEALSPRQRVVIVQRYYLEMSEKDMTAALGIAPGTVKWLLNAARNRLRSLLKSERIAE